MTEENWERQESDNMWFPENAEEEIIGEVTSVDEGSYGIQFTIKQENGEEIVTPSHKVLQNRMAKVKEGDKVKIVFKGEEPPSVKGQNPTKMYEVFVKR